ncbi:NAD(P)H-dependent oxidoreductase subunit E [Neisseriaceae bacterium TC5R-5]|nr:NAD(P)H-dependent oxidoreductase subunit E [Neisseriaceae bacterium TC5R-5]
MNSEQRFCIEALLQQYQHLPGALLPLLQAIQQQLGYLPDASIPLIANTLQLSQAEVHGVISFYHDFRRQPPTRHVLRLCCAEACQCMGAAALATLAAKLADKEVELRPVSCLGACACAPAVELDGQLHLRVDANKLDRLLVSCLFEDATC